MGLEDLLADSIVMYITIAMLLVVLRTHVVTDEGVERS